MYFEEADWCYRMKEAGGEIWYAPVGSVIHYGGGRFGHFDERRLVHYHRSLLYFFRKHYRLRQRVFVRPVLFVRSVVRIVIWGVIAVFQPDHRREAISSARGYLKTLFLLAGRV